MLNDVQSLLPERAQLEARASDLEDIEELVRTKRIEARMVAAERSRSCGDSHAGLLFASL
jgi:hypothetical protein